MRPKVLLFLCVLLGLSISAFAECRSNAYATVCRSCTVGGNPGSYCSADWFSNAAAYTCCEHGCSEGTSCKSAPATWWSILLGILVIAGGIGCCVFCCYKRQCCCWEQTRVTAMHQPAPVPAVIGVVVHQPSEYHQSTPAGLSLEGKS